jgi:peptidoglycan/xylan/chitin deacetylase (PgdA/CDA1 family)
MKRTSFILNWFLHRRASNGLILLYHRVTDLDSDPWQLCVSPGNFEQQMQLLREKYSPVPLHKLTSILRSKHSPLSPVVVTFDDGYADNLYQALPTLEQYEIPATFFLTTALPFQKREFWWDELYSLLMLPGGLSKILHLTEDENYDLRCMGEITKYTIKDAGHYRGWRTHEQSPAVRNETYYTIWKRLYTLSPQSRQSVLDKILEWTGTEIIERPSHRRLSSEEVSTLSQSRVVEIGAHTANHPALNTLLPSVQKREIEHNKFALEEIINRPVTSFAYPHGAYSEETIDIVQQARFSRACTTHPNLVRQNHDCFQLPRFYIGNWDGDELAKRISAWQNPIS